MSARSRAFSDSSLRTSARSESTRLREYCSSEMPRSLKTKEMKKKTSKTAERTATTRSVTCVLRRGAAGAGPRGRPGGGGGGRGGGKGKGGEEGKGRRGKGKKGGGGAPGETPPRSGWGPPLFPLP